jgi:hypothetical protein
VTHEPPRHLWIWLANLLLPGAGAVLLGAVGRGTVLAVVWASAAAFAIAVATFRPELAWAPWGTVPMAAAAGLYVVGQVWVALVLRASRRLRGDAGRDEKFKAALVTYLRGDLDSSAELCRELLGADPDDVEATLQLAAVARGRGDAGAARAHLLRARYLDDAGQWDAEIRRRLDAVEPAAVTSTK